MPEKFALRRFVRVSHTVSPGISIIRAPKCSGVSDACSNIEKRSPFQKSAFNARNVVGLEFSKAELELQLNAERDLLL